jgi:hypothetical protein
MDCDDHLRAVHGHWQQGLSEALDLQARAKRSEVLVRYREGRLVRAACWFAQQALVVHVECSPTCSDEYLVVEMQQAPKAE